MGVRKSTRLECGMAQDDMRPDTSMEESQMVVMTKKASGCLTGFFHTPRKIYNIPAEIRRRAHVRRLRNKYKTPRPCMLSETGKRGFFRVNSFPPRNHAVAATKKHLQI